MKTRYWLFLLLLIPVSGPSLAFSMEDRTTSEGAPNCQALYKQLVDQLGSSPQRNNMESVQVTSLKNGLEIIAQLLDTKGIPKENMEEIEKHAEQLGFKPNDRINIDRAEEFIKNAFPIFEVNLKDIRDLASGKKDANSLLFDSCQRLIPIQVGEEVKSSVTIRLIPGTQGESGQKEVSWRPTRWGLYKLTRQLTEAQKHLKEKTPGLQDFRLVSIPSLNRNFLGYKDDTEIKLVPLFPDRLFKADAPLSADEVFLGLAQEAKSTGARPR